METKSKSAAVKVKPKVRDDDTSHTTLTSLWKTSRKIDQSSQQHKEITKSIAVFLAKDGLPVHTVEKPGFQYLIKKLLSQRYQLPSRKHFSSTVMPKLYDEICSKVSAELHGVTHFSATTDLWSSIGLTPYLSLTVHSISNDWVLISLNLSTMCMPEDHTGVNIADLLKELLAL